jgi:hypothetical protein
MSNHVPLPRDPRGWVRSAVRLGTLLGLVLIGLASVLVVTELVLRVFPGLMPAHAANRAQVFRDLANVRTRPDPYIGFLYPPHYQGTMRHYDASFSFRTDAHGFRNAEPWPTRPDVVVLGDSVTFGFGVPDGQSWVDLAARSLDVGAVNLALPGFGPLQQVRVYETFGAALRPPIVLVGFFPANDFWDTAKFLRWLSLGEGGNYLLWRDFGVNSLGGRSTLQKLLRGSYLQSLVWALVNADPQSSGKDAVAHETRGGRLVLVPSVLDRIRRLARPGRPEFDEALHALKALDQRVRGQGGHMLIVLLPSKESVYLPPSRKPDDDPLHHVYAALQAQGLEYLDVTPRFRERAAAGEMLFFEVDGHPNGTGYALIAETVVEHLRRAIPLMAERRS